MSRRNWKPLIEKVTDEGQCRYCGSGGPLDPAHIWPRSLGGTMELSNIIPLCRTCHTRYDGGQLDILPVLSLDEQIQAVREAGGIARAYRHLIGGST